MSHHLLYIGPLRPETLPLLEPFHSAEQALFVTPTANSEQWEEVRAIFPQATQQVNKVAEANGEHPYYEFNLPEFNASQPASGLYTLYPGLELIESSPQPLVGVEALLNEQQAHPPSVLVIEQPELVWPLLQALAALPSYQQLSQLWLRVGAVPLYQGMPTAEEILNWCQEQGFELHVTHDEDPDLPLLYLTRHPFYERWQEQVKRVTRLTSKLKITQNELLKEKQYNTQMSEIEGKLKKTEKEYYDLIKKNKELESSLEKKNQKIEELEKEIGLNSEIYSLLVKINDDINEGFVKNKLMFDALGKHVSRNLKKSLGDER